MTNHYFESPFHYFPWKKWIDPKCASIALRENYVAYSNTNNYVTPATHIIYGIPIKSNQYTLHSHRELIKYYNTVFPLRCRRGGYFRDIAGTELATNRESISHTEIKKI